MTAEELFIIPSDDNKSELVNGLLVRMPPAGALHGKISLRVAVILDDYVRSHGLGTVAGAETGFILQRDPDTVRAPDVAFVVRGKIPPGGEPVDFWPVAPDLAVEVLSPSERAGDIQGKVAEYLQAGTRLVWVVYPKTRTLAVHRSPHDVRVLSERDDLEGYDVLPGFVCPVRRLFD